MRRYPGDGEFSLFFRPTPGIIHPKQKMLMPGGLGGGGGGAKGWAQLELTDAKRGEGLDFGAWGGDSL